MAGTVKSSIPLPVILTAIDGDNESLALILEHYKGYIRFLSIRRLKDEYGNEFHYVDKNVRLRLEVKLLHSIVTGFKVLPE